MGLSITIQQNKDTKGVLFHNKLLEIQLSYAVEIINCGNDNLK
jgi:hypothetical protein